MTDLQEETERKIRRSLGMEFVRLEDTFDETASLRSRLTSKLVTVAEKVNLTVVSEDGSQTVHDGTAAAVQVVNAALKAIEQTEKAAVNIVGMKLRQNEQEVASAAAHSDRIAVVIAATRAGDVRKQKFDPAALEHTLEQMFDSQIQDSELRSNPNDLSE